MLTVEEAKKEISRIGTDDSRGGGRDHGPYYLKQNGKRIRLYEKEICTWEGNWLLTDNEIVTLAELVLKDEKDCIRVLEEIRRNDALQALQKLEGYHKTDNSLVPKIDWKQAFIELYRKNAGLFASNFFCFILGLIFGLLFL